MDEFAFLGNIVESDSSDSASEGESEILPKEIRPMTESEIQ